MKSLFKKFHTDKKTSDLHIPDKDSIFCMSMGAGVQTTAMLIKFWERYKNGYIIFADTGDENVETYWYIENYLKPFCKEKGLRWKTVTHKSGFSLMQWCMKRKILPIRARRWCTADFKVKPINKFIRSLGATKKKPIYTDIGISLDEVHRANFTVQKPLYVRQLYPLLDNKISRIDCYNIIKEHGWPVPPKSGCDFCMFTKVSKIRKLRKDHPERFKKIVEMEQNDRYYPNKPLIGKKPLDQLGDDQPLDDFMDDDYDEEEQQTCDSGHCFV